MRVFAFCGPIGSGKSSVSRMFAAKAEMGWNSFGSTVKEIALERGLRTDRESLQALGAKLVESERTEFCHRVVNRAVAGKIGRIAIDGLRHVSVLDELRRIVLPDALLCVYVDAPRTIRFQRVSARDGLTDHQLTHFESHSTEVDVHQKLKQLADLVVQNDDSLEECVDAVFRWAQDRKCF